MLVSFLPAHLKLQAERDFSQGMVFLFEIYPVISAVIWNPRKASRQMPSSSPNREQIWCCCCCYKSRSPGAERPSCNNDACPITQYVELQMIATMKRHKGHLLNNCDLKQRAGTAKKPLFFTRWVIFKYCLNRVLFLCALKGREAQVLQVSIRHGSEKSFQPSRQLPWHSHNVKAKVILLSLHIQTKPQAQKYHRYAVICASFELWYPCTSWKDLGERDEKYTISYCRVTEVFFFPSLLPSFQLKGLNKEAACLSWDMPLFRR